VTLALQEVSTYRTWCCAALGGSGRTTAERIDLSRPAAGVIYYSRGMALLSTVRCRMNRMITRRVLGLLLILPALPGRVRADDWPQWRGPERTGLSRATGL